MAKKDEPADNLAILKAVIDQAIAGQPEIARLVYGYWAALVSAGFEGQDALFLTAGYQQDLLHHMQGDADA